MRNVVVSEMNACGVLGGCGFQADELANNETKCITCVHKSPTEPLAVMRTRATMRTDVSKQLERIIKACMMDASPRAARAPINNADNWSTFEFGSKTLISPTLAAE